MLGQDTLAAVICFGSERCIGFVLDRAEEQNAPAYTSVQLSQVDSKKDLIVNGSPEV